MSSLIKMGPLSRFGASLTHLSNIRQYASKVITLESMNPQIKIMEYAVRGPLVMRATEIEKELEKMEYAVRGPLVIRATAIEKELEQGEIKPFKSVLKANIGDCHAMGQKPITFIREVLALITHSQLFCDPSISADAKEHATAILKGCKGQSVGSYTDSNGIEIIRQHVAKFIEERDGYPANPDNIILTNGASEAIKQILRLLISNVDGKKSGVMVPIPQYPLYSASLAEMDLQQVGYYLDECNNWGLDLAELERSITEARKKCNPRAIVVINPGNPTGQVLTKENIQTIIKFAHQQKLIILADEVYQFNIHDKDSKFYSFKKILMEMGEPYSHMELASFMSISKGFTGECGIRGGYSETVNFDPIVKGHLLKCISAGLCATVYGQAVMDTIVNPPRKGEPSYELYEKEKKAILEALKERATLVAQTFNKLKGVECNPVQGAMYAFPKLNLPEKAIEAAKQKGIEPDAFYAFQLLEATGICIIPGSGFGQRPGTYHFRTTILPQTDKLIEMLESLEKFHNKFLEQYQ